MKLNEVNLGVSVGVVSGASMLLLSLVSNIGFYHNAVGMMMQWHMFYSLTPTGMLLGVIEAGVIGFLFGYFIALVYNKIEKR